MMTLPEKELTNKDMNMTGQSSRSEQSGSVDRASESVDLFPIKNVLYVRISQYIISILLARATGSPLTRQYVLYVRLRV